MKRKGQAPKMPEPPPSRILLERGFLGVKHFPSEQAYRAWKQQPWWRRLFS